MNLVHCAPFPDSKILWAGLGPAPDLYWWLTPQPGKDVPILKAGRLRRDALVPLGTVAPSASSIRARFARDASHLLVAGGDILYRLPVANAAASPDNCRIGFESPTDLDSCDGRVVFLARPLSWPPISRLDLNSGQMETLAPSRHEVSKHRPLLAVSPDGHRLVFGHVFDAIEMFDVHAHTSMPWPMSAATVPDIELRSSDLLAHLDFTSDGEHVFAVSHPRQRQKPLSLRVGNVAGREICNRPLVDYLPTLAVAAGGKVVAAARRDVRGRIDVFDATTGETQDTGDVGSRVMALAFGPGAGQVTVVHEGGISVGSAEAR